MSATATVPAQLATAAEFKELLAADPKAATKLLVDHLRTITSTDPKIAPSAAKGFRELDSALDNRARAAVVEAVQDVEGFCHSGSFPISWSTARQWLKAHLPKTLTAATA